MPQWILMSYALRYFVFWSALQYFSVKKKIIIKNTVNASWRVFHPWIICQSFVFITHGLSSRGQHFLQYAWQQRSPCTEDNINANRQCQRADYCLEKLIHLLFFPLRNLCGVRAPLRQLMVYILWYCQSTPFNTVAPPQHRWPLHLNTSPPSWSSSVFHLTLSASPSVLGHQPLLQKKNDIMSQNSD